MKISGSDGRRGQRGLTLLELLIVLALLGLGMTAVSSVIRGPDPGVTVGEAAESVEDLMRLARAEAGGSGRAIGVLIDREGQSIRLPARDREVRLGGGIRISARLAREATRDGVPAILFFPDGSSTGGRLTLTDGTTEIVLSVHWLTGETRVALDDRD